MQMDVFFALAALVALIAAFMVITRRNAIHALLYLVVTLLALAVVFYLLGAALAAALEVIVYAGAIVVLFIFVVMLLNLGVAAEAQETLWLKPGTWIGPAVLSSLLLAEMAFLLLSHFQPLTGPIPVAPKEVGTLLYGPYLLAVELASLLLLAALAGVWHIGRGLRQEAAD